MSANPAKVPPECRYAGGKCNSSRCPCREGIDELRAQQKARIEKEGGALFLGLPDRWLDDPHFRCVEGHVRTGTIKSEVRGDMCPTCLGPTMLTFPEDSE